MPGVTGRVALVTGAGRGIGRATAALLVSRGARVMAVARSEQELKSLGLDSVAADLSTPEGCDLAVNPQPPGTGIDPGVQSWYRLGPRAGGLGAGPGSLAENHAHQSGLPVFSFADRCERHDRTGGRNMLAAPIPAPNTACWG